MLSQAIGGILPVAIGVALSPIPIVAVVLMLSTPKGRANGAAFALGWLVGLAAVAAAVLLIAGGSSDPDSATATGVEWGKVAIGVLFLAMARRQWAKRPKEGEDAEMPTWLATVDGFTPVRSLVLGLALSAANPKNLALTLAAGATIAQAGLAAGQEVVAVAVFVVLGSLTTVGLVVYATVARRSAERHLASIKTFMAGHNAVIMFVILLVLGAKLIGDGVGALGS